MTGHVKTVQDVNAVVIWMHGLGADANDMKGLASELLLESHVEHIFLNAPIRAVTLNNHMPMRAWYDIYGMEFQSREDREGILQSEAMVSETVAEQIAAGVDAKRIFLAGFSQGGAIALFTGLRSTVALGGLIVLSAYLPLAEEQYAIAHKDTPIFCGLGLYDPLVLPQWTRDSVQWIKARGISHVSLHEYPMEHSVCHAEIRDLSIWLNQQVDVITQKEGE